MPQAVWQWLAGALDELDYGIVVLFDGTSIVHINDAAKVELDDCTRCNGSATSCARASRATSRRSTKR